MAVRLQQHKPNWADTMALQGEPLDTPLQRLYVCIMGAVLRSDEPFEDKVRRKCIFFFDPKNELSGLYKPPSYKLRMTIGINESIGGWFQRFSTDFNMNLRDLEIVMGGNEFFGESYQSYETRLIDLPSEDGSNRLDVICVSTENIKEVLERVVPDIEHWSQILDSHRPKIVRRMAKTPHPQRLQLTGKTPRSGRQRDAERVAETSHPQSVQPMPNSPHPQRIHPLSAVTPRPQTPVVTPRPQMPATSPWSQTPAITPRPQTPVVTPRPQTPVVTSRPQTPVVTPRPQMPPPYPQMMFTPDSPRPQEGEIQDWDLFKSTMGLGVDPPWKGGPTMMELEEEVSRMRDNPGGWTI